MRDNRGKSDNELLQEISSKLTQLIAMNGLSGLEKNDQVRYLVNFDFTILEISRLTGLPSGTVGRIKAEQKRKRSV